MTDVHEKVSVECEKDECEFVQGNTVVIETEKGDCEIRADVIVKKEKCVRIWGQVKDCKDRPVEGALVKLVREIERCEKKILLGVAHTVTDCEGFYQFDICSDKKRAIYKVIVGKAAMGKERKVCGECEVCEKKDWSE